MQHPNINMIASSLRSCSLGRRRDSSAPPPENPAGDLTVDLNSDIPVPYPWQQHLDLKTGQVYYKNLRNGEKTINDPRKLNFTMQYYYYSEDKEEEEDEEDDDDDDDDDDEEEETSSEDEDGTSSGEEDKEDTCYSEVTCASSPSTSSTATSRYSGGGSGEKKTLVLAGCKACFLYLMVPKHDESCPRCNGELLQLGINGCT